MVQIETKMNIVIHINGKTQLSLCPNLLGVSYKNPLLLCRSFIQPPFQRNVRLIPGWRLFPLLLMFTWHFHNILFLLSLPLSLSLKTGFSLYFVLCRKSSLYSQSVLSLNGLLSVARIRRGGFLNSPGWQVLEIFWQWDERDTIIGFRVRKWEAKGD